MRDDALSTAQLVALRPLVHEQLRYHGGLVAGAGFVAAPGVRADTPRALEWWCLRGGRIVPLELTLDPLDVSFTEYTELDWYVEPQRTHLPVVAGPRVDDPGTLEHMLTAAIPVRAPGDEFLGVCAADVRMGQVECLVLPLMRRLGEPAALVSREGRVTAGLAGLPSRLIVDAR